MMNFNVMKRILVILCAVALVVNANAQEVSTTYDPDVDGDNNIGVTDLLALLSLFSENDLDDDGIWDSQDDCVGEYDECGVCNGGGVPCPCSSPVAFDGYEYAVIEIGDQCWFAENLRSEHYSNGDTIPGDLHDDDWEDQVWSNTGARAVYYNDTTNLADYGRLYNWYAVDDARGLCPSGWHVPSDEEWTILVDTLGGLQVAGGKMKSSPYDSPSWNGTNESGFSGQPGGYIENHGQFGLGGTDGLFWSTSAGQGDYKLYRRLLGQNSSVQSNGGWPMYGYSIRCLKDSEE